MIIFIHKLLRRLRNALHGIYLAIWFDHAFKVHLTIGIGLCILALLAYPLTEVESLFLALSWILILITEIQNSALEEALNRIHPEVHEAIGKSKDMAAGAVLLAGCFMAIVVIVICIRHCI